MKYLIVGAVVGSVIGLTVRCAYDVAVHVFKFYTEDLKIVRKTVEEKQA